MNLNNACLACGTKHGGYVLKELNGYKIYKCCECGLEYTLPNPGNDDLVKFYSSYSDVRASREIVLLNAEKNIKLLERFGLSRDASLVLDFGCGNGEFVEICGSKCYGVDLKPNPTCDRIKNSLEELPIKKFDFIMLWGVLEHLNDVVGVINNLYHFLNEGGYLVITTVNAEGAIPYWHKPPEHLTYWTKKSFTILAERFGLNIASYENYEMYQYSAVYLDRLLSRTPEEYVKMITGLDLPEIIYIPTNEVFVVMKKVKKYKRAV